MLPKSEWSDRDNKECCLGFKSLKKILFLEINTCLLVVVILDIV